MSAGADQFDWERVHGRCAAAFCCFPGLESKDINRLVLIHLFERHTATCGRGFGCRFAADAAARNHCGHNPGIGILVGDPEPQRGAFESFTGRSGSSASSFETAATRLAQDKVFLMSSTAHLMLKEPRPGPRFARPEDRLRRHLEARTSALQPLYPILPSFLTTSRAGRTSNCMGRTRAFFRQSDICVASRRSTLLPKGLKRAKIASGSPGGGVG
jgi:hypothetical protein